MRILRLNKAGDPLSWITKEHAAELYCKGHVVWELGERELVLSGGINRSGEQSKLWISPVIASSGRVVTPEAVTLSNEALFRRDQNICLYCGNEFSSKWLTRDHVIPRGQGGKDIWENVVASCKSCNSQKGCRTPEEANLELLAVPFRPNRFEWMFLQNKNILADQMEYLKVRFSNNRDWIQ